MKNFERKSIVMNASLSKEDENLYMKVMRLFLATLIHTMT